MQWPTPTYILGSENVISESISSENTLSENTFLENTASITDQ